MSTKNSHHYSKTDWKRVDEMADNEIDYSEIPELDDAFFQNAKLYMKHHKDTVVLYVIK